MARQCSRGFCYLSRRHQIADNYTLTDVDGKKYINLIFQFAIMNFGYSPPKIVKAAVE